MEDFRGQGVRNLRRRLSDGRLGGWGAVGVDGKNGRNQRELRIFLEIRGSVLNPHIGAVDGCGWARSDARRANGF